MRHHLLRLAIAIIAFIVGVTTAAIFGASFAPRARQSAHVYVGAPPPAKLRSRSCPQTLPAPQVLGELPAPPEPPAAPEPPPPPALAKPSGSVRVVVRRPDGTVQVIEESRTEQSVEHQAR